MAKTSPITILAGAGLGALAAYYFLQPAHADPGNGNGNGDVSGTINIRTYIQGTTNFVETDYELTLDGDTQTGVTPALEVPAMDGQAYSITVFDPPGYQFVEWGDGSTNRVRSGTLDFSVIDFFSPNAYFTPIDGNGGEPGQETATVDVRAYDIATIDTNPLLVEGVPITISGGPEGTRTSISENDAATSFTITVGETYTVSVGNAPGWTFVEWANGSTSPSRSLTSSTPDIIISYNAYYDIA